MKREILFRGKRVDNGEWISGNLFIPNQLVKGCFICSETTFVDFYPSFEDGDNLEDFKNNGISLGHFHEIVPETIGQFTGLTDKNGKKMFENDILNIFWEVGLGDTAEVITYCEKYGYFKYGNNPICEILEDEKVSYLVIGNIHEK